MSVLRSSGLLVVGIVFLAAVAGCGGTASPGTSASVGAGTTPAPGSTPAPPASQPAEPTDDGGTVVVSNPPIVDGAFTSGKLHVEVSGDVTATIDKPLQGGLSFSNAGATILSYLDPATGDGGGVVLSPDGNAITLSTAAVSTAGAGVISGGIGCTISVTQSDASRLAGTFDCKRLPGVVAATSRSVTIDMRGTFEASR